MRKIIFGALIAAVALPTAAQAQSQAEIRQDRREIRQGQREVARDIRRGDYREAREDAREVREDRQELREDRRDRRWGRDDWRGYRNSNRGLYARGNWRAPFGYNQFRAGTRIRSVYYGPQYVINDPWRYRLPPARPGARWVRHYNDVLLVDLRRGIVLDVIRSFYW
jgi:Ni/Co efflux regulator RcnB